MAKKTVKRKMKKQVRKTLGALFLASAVAVAAIPTGSYDGGMANAGITTNEEGVEIYTHVVESDWRLGSDSSSHTESYPIKSSTTDGIVSLKSIFVDTQGQYTDGLGAGYEGAIAASTQIPLCKEDTTIYSTRDGDYKFAYVDRNGDQNGDGTKFAVILAYEPSNPGAGGNLEIPETVDAYLNLNDNDKTQGLTAVGKSGNYLFYQTKSQTEFYTQKTVQKIRESDGEPVYYVSTDLGATYINTVEFSYEEAVEEYGSPEFYTLVPVPRETPEYTYYAPCEATKYDTWKNETLYYYPTSNYKATGTPLDSATFDETGTHVIPQPVADSQAYGWITNADVRYIGNQYLNNANKIAGVITSPSQGVFNAEKAGGIGTLIIGQNLLGIGDYAFYNCNIGKVEFSSGLNTIGNHAFDNCTSLTSVTIPNYCSLQTIGAYAFKGCRALSSFSLSANIANIGDGAFKNCVSLQTIYLDAEGGGRLASLGAYVFQNCKSLTSITFPNWYTETIELSEFEGCNALQYIRAESSQFKLVDSTTCDFTWEAFRKEFNNEEKKDILKRTQFYFETLDSSPMHQICTDNELCFKILDSDVYELTKEETSIAGQKGTVTYQVNGSGVLTGTTFNGPVTSVIFPEYIGPNTISQIGSRAFQDKCTLTEITINSAIEEIGTGAFQGCHNLKYVYFEDNNVVINSGAFTTQAVSSHDSTYCQDYNGLDTNGKAVRLYDSSTMTDSNNMPTVQLHFVGDVASGNKPYDYAMSFDGRFNDPNRQNTSYVEFLSGWPTMLTIQYHYNMAEGVGYSELVDFPTQNTLSAYANAEYLTDDQKSAARDAMAMVAAGNATEQQQIFYNAAYSLTIPVGVDAIKDGVYADKTVGISSFPVTCYGLKKIEANYIKNSAGDVLYYADDSVADENGVPNPDPERNYFPRADVANSDFAGASALNKIFILGDTEIEPYAFQYDRNLTDIEVTGSVSELGEHAFWGDSSLKNVTFAGGLSSMGTAPFKGCTALSGSGLSFGDGSNYTCENDVIFGVSDGRKASIIEVLPNRNYSMRETELDSSVTSIAPEAFIGSKITNVNLTGTGITAIPEHAFYQMEGSSTVALPNTCATIQPYAFEDSHVYEISARNVRNTKSAMLDGIVVSGGVTDHEDTSRNNQVTIYTPEGSDMYEYAVAYDYKVDKDISKENYAVKFYGYNADTGLVDVQVYTTTVEDGANLLPTEVGLASYNAVSSYKDDLGYYHVLDGWQDSNRRTYTENEMLTLAITSNTEFYGNYVVRTGQTYSVSFNDYSGNVIKTYTITEGNTLEQEEKDPPVLSDVTEDGVTYTHNGWKKSGELSVTDVITRDVTFDPIYTKLDTGTYTVTFNYIDPTTSKLVSWTRQTDVAEGSDISKSVAAPTIEGYTFSGWDNATATPDDGDITNVTCDFTLVGTFTSDSGSGSGSTDSSDSSSNTKPSGGSNETVQINGFTIPAYDTSIFAVALYYDINGNPFAYRLVNIGSKAPDIAKPDKYVNGYAWSPSPEETTVNDVAFFNLVPYTPTPSSSGSDTTGKFYTLTVVNGSGSGSYQADSTVIVVANDPPSGQEFSNWTIEPSSAKLASTVMSATTVAMPTESVTVTAHYKTKSSSSSSSGNSSSNNANRSGSTGTVSNKTTVVIDKNGLSNTAVVSATVKGSSDNFTIKIKESSDASNAIVKALQNEYGDISTLKYFPMDISLYDATGTKLITDTTGLSINITLPLPDSLIPYAGNNKVASVVNNRLDKISPKFTTIDGVACVTFTAEHFSPYVIYVDTNNLSASITADNTPKTGDGIHPKWFLSIGLACISAVLFLKRDKKTAVRVTTA